MNPLGYHWATHARSPEWLCLIDFASFAFCFFLLCPLGWVNAIRTFAEAVPYLNEVLLLGSRVVEPLSLLVSIGCKHCR